MNGLYVDSLTCEYRSNPLGIDAVKPRLSWKLKSEQYNIMQAAYQIQAALDESFDTLVWDTGKIESDRSVHIRYEGAPLESRTCYYYRVRIWDTRGNASGWSAPAWWETALLDCMEWKASWISPEAEQAKVGGEPCPMLRRSFSVKGKVRSARVYATSLGLYELHLNGKRVGDWQLTPGWTSYNKRLQYQTYDVTTMLASGDNAIGVVLGDGWYKGNLAWESKRNIYGDRVAALVQLHIRYEDGSEDVVVSDRNWKASTGPILFSEIYHGETYDARLEKAGWDMPGYGDAAWSTVTVLEKPLDILVAQENVPTRPIDRIEPVRLFSTPAGETVLDMGQNMVGWLSFSVTGTAGDRVVLNHAEVLDKEGNFYTDNMRKARNRIEYILKGEGEERFEPHFTFQGFRYVRLNEFPGVPALENFTGIVIHSEMEPSGSFECSDAMINQLQHNIVWGQKGNFVDVPTDCPQRDERLGWTGDAQVFARTACFNMGAALFFTKWLRDLRADQLPDGGVPHVIPNVLGDGDHSACGWADAATIIPWTHYLCYGDEGILSEQYDSMKAWVERVRRQGENEYLWNTGFHFGDWVALDAKEGSYFGATPDDLLATAFYAYSTGILARTAGILGREADKKEYEALHANIVEAFRKEFVTPNGRIVSPTQTGHIVPLLFGLLEDKDRKRTLDTLVKLLENNKMHLTTGFLGTPYLCHVLSENGRADIAYQLLMQTDYPSWLYQVTRGATTIWEHWDGLKPDGTFWSADMNSFNHYAYGSIGDWMYRVIAGIDTDDVKPGYKHIHIRPKPGGGLTYAAAQLETMYGTVASRWEKTDGIIRYTVTIPPNTTAAVLLPDVRLEELKVNGESAASCEGVTAFEEASGGVQFMVGSGMYTFE